MEDDDFKWFQRIRTVLLVIIILVLALAGLGGCVTSSNDLLTEATLCGGDEECDELWARWNKLDDRLAKKERERAIQNSCRSNGGVMYCEARLGRKRCQCVPEESIREMMRNF